MSKTRRRKPRHRIPESELRYRFSRSSGPGGQSVNTSDSKVEVLWPYATSSVVDDTQRQRVEATLAGRTTDGYVTVVSQQYKSQHRNREAARVRLEELVADALTVRRTRRPTRPSRGANEKRLAAKRRRSETKQSRRGDWS